MSTVDFADQEQKSNLLKLEYQSLPLSSARFQPKLGKINSNQTNEIKSRNGEENYTTRGAGSESVQQKLSLKNMLGDTKKEIAKFIKDIYEQKDQATINEYVKNAEGKKLVQKDINEMKVHIQQFAQNLNNMKYQTSQKRLDLELLSSQHDQLEQISESQKISQEERLKQMESLYEKNDTKLNMEEMQGEQYENMVNREKEMILWYKLPILNLKKDHKDIDCTRKQLEVTSQDLENETKKLNTLLMEMSDKQKSRNVIINNQLQQCLTEVEQKQIFHEIYKNQYKIQQKEENEQIKLNFQQVKEKNQDFIKQREQEESNRQQSYKLEMKYQQDLLKLQQSCNLKEILDLESYNNDLQFSKEQMKNLMLMLKEKKDRLEQEKQKAVEDLISAKYLETKNSKEQTVNQSTTDTSSQFDIKDQNADYIQEKILRALEIKEDKLRKCQKIKQLKAQAMISLSRIALQCKNKKPQDQNDIVDDQKSVESQPTQIINEQNLAQTLSLCGMRLEHMISVSEKVRMINPLIFNQTKIKDIVPQDYLGIDFKQYVQIPDQEDPSNKNLIGAFLLQEQQSHSVQSALQHEHTEVSLKELNQAKDQQNNQHFNLFDALMKNNSKKPLYHPGDESMFLNTAYKSKKDLQKQLQLKMMELNNNLESKKGSGNKRKASTTNGFMSARNGRISSRDGDQIVGSSASDKLMMMSAMRQSKSRQGMFTARNNENDMQTAQNFLQKARKQISPILVRTKRILFRDSSEATQNK
eukprot:403346604